MTYDELKAVFADRQVQLAAAGIAYDATQLGLVSARTEGLSEVERGVAAAIFAAIVMTTVTADDESLLSVIDIAFSFRTTTLTEAEEAAVRNGAM
jgi:hypothetical protein